jgi:hypothetical protein
MTIVCPPIGFSSSAQSGRFDEARMPFHVRPFVTTTGRSGRVA